MGPAEVRLIVAQWPGDERDIRSVREEVFVFEQGVPLNLDIDGRDPDCAHVLAVEDEAPVGTARMQQDGHIGRVAVLARYRGRGIGRLLVAELIGTARSRGLDQVYLHSQTSATEFYVKLGFERYGQVFMEADIPHIAMCMALNGTRTDQSDV